MNNNICENEVLKANIINLEYDNEKLRKKIIYLENENKELKNIIRNKIIIALQYLNGYEKIIN